MERAGRLIGQLKISGSIKDPEARVRAVWARAAGKTVARHTRPTNLVRGTLVVEVEDMVWQRQLATIRHFILRNLAQELGEVVVEEIDFRPMPGRRRPQRAETARPESRDDADRITDPVLRGLYIDARKKKQA